MSMSLTISDDQQVTLHVAGTTPDGTLPADPAPTWTTADDTIVGLAFPSNDPNSVVAIGLQAGGPVNVTATSGIETFVFAVTVVSAAQTAVVGSADLPKPQNDLQKTRGRGLGLGYQ